MRIETICIGHFLKEKYLPRCKMCRPSKENIDCPYYNGIPAEVSEEVTSRESIKIYEEKNE